MGRLANLGAATKIGYLRQRQNYHGDYNPSPALQQQIQAAAQAEGPAMFINQTGAKAGRLAGATVNFAQEHPYIAGGGALLAGTGLGYMLLSGGNSTDAEDSKQSAQLNPMGARSPNYVSPQDLDGKLKQRTLQRLNEQIQLNQIYINALNG